MDKPIRRTKLRHLILTLIYSGEGIRWNREQGYHAPGGHKLTKGALEAVYLFAEHEMVGVTRSGWVVTTPAGTDLCDSWPQRGVDRDLTWFVKPEEETVKAPQLPEARLIVSNLDGTPLYFVFKTEKGWVGAPGLRKGQVLTDEDVKDGIPYVPASPSEDERIAMSIHGRYLLERSGIDDLPWVSANGQAHYDDDEVYELTHCESVVAGVDPTSKVADFFGAKDYGIHDAASDSPSYLVRKGDFEGSILLEEGARVWRLENLFHVLQPNQNCFQTIPRVRNS